MSMDVPTTLARLPQWVLWKYLGSDRRKVPYQIDGTEAKSNDPSTWTTLEQAQEALTTEYAGLGFVFAVDGGLVGIDLDGCISAAGEIEPWAVELVEKFSSYAEYSPSGTGIKIWCCGKSPFEKGKKRTVDFKQVCEKKPAVEVYDHKRFFCFTGQHLPGPLEPQPRQAEINWFCQRFWPAVEAKPTSSTGTHINVIERARLYLSKIEPAISGSGGHNQTFYAACRMVVGFGLSAEVAYSLLAEWNQTCQPPWSEKELRHKVSEAAKQQGERGYLLVDKSWESLETIDLSGIIGSKQEPEDDEPAAIIGRLPAACLSPVGLLGDIMDHCRRSSRYDQPELSLGAALSLIGTITGRKITDEFGTRTNIYILGLDESGTGKEHARQVNKDLLLRAGGEKLHGSERVGSHAGIVNAVFESPALLMQLDEIGRLLATMKDPRKAPHLYNCITVLMQLYSSSGTIWKADAYADSKKVKTINQPHLCIYGTATPDSFWHNLSTENIAEGLVGRLMVLEGRGYDVDMVKPESFEAPAELIEAIRWWLEYRPGGNLATENPIPTVVKHTPEAERRFMQHVQDINKRRRKENKLRAALWSRSGEKAAKLALIHACSRARLVPGRIELDDVEYGIRLANWITRRILTACVEHVSENEQEAKAKRILQIVGSEELTLNQLTRRTQWLRSRERRELIEDLIGCGMLAQEQIETNGRAATRLFRPNKRQKQA